MPLVGAWHLVRYVDTPDWTKELKNRKIRVNVVSPRPINTPGVNGLFTDPEQAKQLKAGFAAQVPLARVGEPDELAKAEA